VNLVGQHYCRLSPLLIITDQSIPFGTLPMALAVRSNLLGDYG